MRMSDAERARREKIVIDDCQGILPYTEAFYLESIAYTAGRAVSAFIRFDEAVSTKDSNDDIVAAVQEALTHVAALSRFFWPARKTALSNARGKRLREAFQVPEGSPLQSRELRNALEHFDERLDEFLLEDHAGSFFPSAMVDDASLSEEQTGHIFRLVDPKTSKFVLLGTAYSFGELHREAERIQSLAEESSDRGGRLR
jgi:hypothetical protein